MASGNDSNSDRQDGKRADIGDVLDLSSELIQFSSPNGVLLRVNRIWRSTLGYSDDELQRLLAMDVVHPDQQEAMSEIIRDVAVANTARAFTSTLVTRDGRAVPVAGQIDCRAIDGLPVEYRAVMRDLRHDRSTTAALAEVEAQFAAVFESPAIGMAVQGLDGRWLAVNVALAEILGYPPSELITMTYQEITYPDDLEFTTGQMQRLISGEARRVQIDKRYIHRDGSIISAILTVSVVTDQTGQPLRFISQIQDVTARRTLETQLLHKASHDVLTGLPNRALFMDRLEHALARLPRAEGQIAVMFLDLDGFKLVNDQFGHEQGDRLLVEIGRRLRACARAGDTIGRIGGDEFTVLLEHIRHPSVAVQVAQRIRETLRYPIVLGEHVTTISPSIGIAISTGNDERAEAILHDADTAMYAAKRAGKDRAVLADRRSRG